MSVANAFAFSTWNALHTNYAVDVIGFGGEQQGILHTLREIPGFLAFAAVFLLLIMREQTLGILSVLTIGVGVAITGFFPSALGFYATTVVKSLGFHYYETVAQSLALQWFDKKSGTQPPWPDLLLCLDVDHCRLRAALRHLEMVRPGLCLGLSGGGLVAIAIGLSRLAHFPALREWRDPSRPLWYCAGAIGSTMPSPSSAARGGRFHHFRRADDGPEVRLQRFRHDQLLLGDALFTSGRAPPWPLHRDLGASDARPSSSMWA